MSKRLHEQKYFLLFLLEAPSKQFSSIIRHLPAEQALVLKEIVVNLLTGDISIDDTLKGNLRKYQHLLRAVQGKSPSGLRKVLQENLFKLRRILGYLYHE